MASGRVIRTLAAGALVLILGWGVSALPARADGDPASDVLATQSLFLPQDAGIPPAQQAQLGKLARDTAEAGVQIRVALIASASDLGSVTELWRRPRAYANFLGEELSLTYRGLLLVIMPNGFGLYDQGHPVGGESAALTAVALHGSGTGLALTAEDAVRTLAAAAGHPVALPRATATSSPGSPDPTPWIVFALGLVAIAVAWIASLRARPLGVEPDHPAAP
ncbi:MAG TPA: hypothetical protein VMD09_14900 [Solirubrobacteraceae bacterium]|nr:hypothetical protein [Solirubrobacteraceae bacterium]